MDKIINQLAFLGKPLIEDIVKNSDVQFIPKGTEILRQEQYVKVLPILLSGLVKVYSQFGDRELLLYYIQPNESCVMSFSASLKNSPSKVFAVTEEDSEILLIPVNKVPELIKEHPSFNNLFYDQYNMRYTELLETIQHVIMDKMDKRLLDHLKSKASLLNQTSFKISHSQIANELGTVREVISRVMKKLETEGFIEQNNQNITLLV